MSEHVTKQAACIAAEALALCGTGFRLHGRDSVHGLDCIGLADLCFEAAGIDCDVPGGYSIRGGNLKRITEFMASAGFESVPLDGRSPEQIAREGDVALASPSPVQWHFLIRANGGYVHAHAGVGKVVFSPGASPWPIRALFRLMEI